jgi:hypothetical protein
LQDLPPRHIREYFTQKRKKKNHKQKRPEKNKTQKRTDEPMRARKVSSTTNSVNQQNTKMKNAKSKEQST